MRKDEQLNRNIVLVIFLLIGAALTGCSKKQAPEPAAGEESPAEFVFGGIKESVSNLGK